MTKDKPKGPAQPDPVDHAETQRNPSPHKDEKIPPRQRREDMPGADGRLSARADEDTYD
jgi:hypothetical protein